MLSERDAQIHPISEILSKCRTKDCGLQDRLEEMVSELVSAQNQAQEAKDQLEKINASLEEFVSVASHDLQVPLRKMRCYIDLLESRFKGQLDIEADKFMLTISKSAERMQHLIADLLSYARTNGEIKVNEVVPLDTVIRNVVRDLETIVAQADATISYSNLPVVNGSLSQIHRLFQNLISNAIKYRREEPPEILISSEEKENGWVISVADNGLGLENGEEEKIFKAFYRGRSGAAVPGSGIGLAICQKIVEGHGGKLWVESNHGKGSVFRFSLPKKVIEDQAII